jgi:ankyrin repeat protein
MSNDGQAEAQVVAGFSEIHFACASERTDQVPRLLSEGINPDSRDMYGESCLHIVAQNNSPEILKMVIDQKADINAINGYGATPLHTASSSGSEECIRILLECGGETNLLNCDNQTAFAVCVDPKTKSLFESTGQTDYSDQISPKIARRNSGELSGFSELHYACASKRAEKVTSLLAGGLDPNHRDIYGETGLHPAVQNNWI